MPTIMFVIMAFLSSHPPGPVLLDHIADNRTKSMLVHSTRSRELRPSRDQFQPVLNGDEDEISSKEWAITLVVFALGVVQWASIVISLFSIIRTMLLA